MINIERLSVNPLQENCFIVTDQDSGETAVIDPGTYFDEERQAMLRLLRTGGRKPTLVLLTHGHFDHIFGCDTLYETFGLKPRLHPADDDIYRDIDTNMRPLMGIGYERTLPELGPSLSHGDVLHLGSTPIHVLSTPGHSPGSVCFYLPTESLLFSGDTLFRMSIGRTDLWRGSYHDLQQSLQQVLAPLPPATTVCPGHGPATTMADERRFNPHFSIS